ncbi:MAG: MtaA/CmuA family methyltransferase, partial [Candidatus Omnitrophica bacterium]|nr:MtaA/CmuA family methyltransferase [Candidatus Omnitrophota bacterium]
MSPKRRFLTAMLGGKPDRVPVGNVVSVATVYQMRATGAWFPKAHLEPQSMARLAIAGHEILGFDTLMPVYSVVQEAAALGCRVDWGGPDMMPAVRSHPFAETGDFRIRQGWMESSSIQVVLEAMGLLRKHYGDHVVIVGKVMGPWSLSYHMLGVEDFLISTLCDRDKARRSLNALKEVTIAFARAQVQAGADIICLADHATGGMVSPLAYRDMLLPLHQEIVNEIGCPIVLHCCGNTTDRLGYFARTGIDCYHFESQVPIQEAVAAASGKMTLMGNINNPELLLRGTPDQVAEACRNAIAHGVHILSPECAVPLTTPRENLQISGEFSS